jgi:hypothetical protein
LEKNLTRQLLTGSDTRPYLREWHETVKAWMPHAENVVLSETTHAIPEANPSPKAELLADFFSRHPIERSSA